jgi:PAS domain S-box-containing protein
MMSTNLPSLRSESFFEIGRVIRRDAGLLLEQWAHRAAQEQPQAARVHHDTLLDHIGSLLHVLGQGLEESLDLDACPHCVPADAHGEQRWENGWSLSEVVGDYGILRRVLLEHLEEALGRPLAFREAAAVGMALDDAIASSVAAYVRHRDAHLERVEAERARQERQSKENDLRWGQIVQHAGWGIALLGPEEDLLQIVNPACARMHGYVPEELIGRPFGELVAPECQADLTKHLHTVQPQGPYGFEAIHRRRDGSHFPVLAQVTVVRDEARKVILRAVNLQDITAPKRVEQSLREQTEALRSSDRRKNDFLAMLAHELRNPLAPILHAVEALRLQGPAEPSLEQARGVIERQARQMARLVDDLLDMARIAQGKLELRRSRFDLAQVVGEAVQTTAPLFEAQGHRLDVHLPERPLPLEADLARVVQILVNLLSNAAKYTDRGGKVHLSAAQEDSQVVVRVRDNGIGIEREMLGRVFDLFTQVDRSLDRAQGGLGIGLTLVRQLVDLHGGSVAVHSEGPGKGSEFIVRLPMTEDAALPATQDAPAPAAKGRHVLIIEDNADARSSLATLLTLLGHRVETAATGMDGVARALAVRPEVALIDLGLPGVDGCEVARRLRAVLGQGVRLIALTGHAQEEDRRRTQEAGFDAHLVKPVEVEELNRVLGADRG